MNDKYEEIIEITSDCLIDENVEILLESSDESSSKKFLEIFYCHLSKCKCQPSRICASWMYSFNNSRRFIKKFIKNTNNLNYLTDIISDASKNGIKLAKKDICNPKVGKIDYTALKKLNSFSFEESIISIDFILSDRKIKEYILDNIDDQFIKNANYYLDNYLKDI